MRNGTKFKRFSKNNTQNGPNRGLKKLHLTVLCNEDNRESLIDTFGRNYRKLSQRNSYLQFTFENINLLNGVKLKPIIDLINTYERNHSHIRSIVLHLADKHSYASTYLTRIYGNWNLCNTTNTHTTQSGDIYKLIP